MACTYCSKGYRCRLVSEAIRISSCTKHNDSKPFADHCMRIICIYINAKEQIAKLYGPGCGKDGKLLRESARQRIPEYI